MLHVTNPGISIILQHLDFADFRGLNMPMWLRHVHRSTSINKCKKLKCYGFEIRTSYQYYPITKE